MFAELAFVSYGFDSVPLGADYERSKLMSLQLRRYLKIQIEAHSSNVTSFLAGSRQPALNSKSSTRQLSIRIQTCLLKGRM